MPNSWPTIVNYIKICILTFLIFPGIISAQESEIILNGIYQGKNLLIQNPLGADGIDYCIEEIHLNDVLVLSGPRISAVEMVLDSLEINDPVMIRIVHGNNCVPLLLNPDALIFKREFRFLAIKVGRDSVHWKTHGEDSSGRHQIEKLIDQQWQPIQAVPAIGAFEENQYHAPLSHEIGVNYYRIQWIGDNGQIGYSRPFEYLVVKEPITFSPRLVIDWIHLSEETFYEVLDTDMNQVTKGEGKQINLRSLPAGSYFLVLDGVRHQFNKK